MDKNLLSRVADYAKQPRKARAAPAPLVIKSAQLPLWSNDVRGLPNSLARSALFSITRQNAPRRQLLNAPIVTIGPVSMLYTGEELRQDDEDVWLQAAHLARFQPLAEPVLFTPYSMLKALQLSPGTANYKRLAGNLERLQGARLKITRAGADEQGGFKDLFIGNLIRKVVARDRADPADSRWKVWLEPEVVAMFGENDYSLLDFDQRLKLSPLGKFLHSFYHTHREPYGYKVETLLQLCRSESKHLFHFRARLKASLEELKHIGFLKSWEIRNDVVYVVRQLKAEPLLLEGTGS